MRNYDGRGRPPPLQESALRGIVALSLIALFRIYYETYRMPPRRRRSQAFQNLSYDESLHWKTTPQTVGSYLKWIAAVRSFLAHLAMTVG
jgi:hypothetical protein